MIKHYMTLTNGKSRVKTETEISGQGIKFLEKRGADFVYDVTQNAFNRLCRTHGMTDIRDRINQL